MDLAKLVRDVDPERTVLLFGAGSSIPSGAPSVAQLQRRFEKAFDVPGDGYGLSEQAGIIENKIRDRRRLIEELQSAFVNLKPTGAILNLPLYNWKSIYTTNYDELIESAYARQSKSIKVYSTNFDFGMKDDPAAVELFKLHGTISKDVCFGDRSRIILTESDYDVTDEYRDQLFERLKSDIGASHLIIIGHSLADDDVRSIVNRALALKSKAGLTGRISVLLYVRDEGRASLLEARGADVIFAGLDDFFAGITAKIAVTAELPLSKDPLDQVVVLRPATLDVGHEMVTQPSNVSSMYNGWPATFGDISSGLTFRRRVADELVEQFDGAGSNFAIVLGPSGVGKTTAARQALCALSQAGYHAWQHKAEQTFQPARWRELAHVLRRTESKGVLLIDNAHSDLSKINELVEALERDKIASLKLILVSTNHNWGPRVKSPVLFKGAKVYSLNKVSGEEIDGLLDLVERKSGLRALVEGDFAGYSRAERRRRLTQRCEADMFVCLKNIFSSDKLDEIILREFAELDPILQDIYKSIAAMESAGVHVHRQLVIRMLGISAGQISGILARLADIIHENVVDEKRGIYSWYGRHKVIMSIVAEYKYFDKNSRYDLFERVIENISPTYNIEISTIRDLCGSENGISKISDLKSQNILLRKMISVAPGEKVPRHRLIRNLIELGHFDSAETEIKTFKVDFKIDAPTTRYLINLATARAVRAKGLMKEDRIVLLQKAEQAALVAARKYRNVKGVLGAYCEVGIETAKLTGRSDVFETAIAMLRTAEESVGDPEMGKLASRFERRMSTVQLEPSELELEDTVEE
jgi:hypothetical protein